MKGDINLLPEDIMSTTSYERPSSGSGALKLVIGLILVGVVVGTSLLAPFLHVKMLERELAQLEKEIASQKYNEVKKVNSDLDSINGVLGKKEAVLNQIDNASYPINDILVAVSNAAPIGCKLTAIEFKNNKMKLTGLVEDNLVVAEFVSAIQRLSFLALDSEVKIEEGNVFELTVLVGRKGEK
ncbi:PilN domain-containing protein [Acetivibrio straminisolvens]|jgi:type IV pilus assembly protein PilN|uniref:Fimbrial assembly protein n=1 Tax=Acetivibrio straminisolvens JCM 21531 TaxID=1294263 RepID=W4V4F9_9FIRM|nr:PilN domain-containing protein [Acetivibrio straminisolvens]GAE88022.1 fimbrial assembly protein [Acetivibrio straminisolvens JCM 21531]